jgi:hypothetical protein
MAGAIPLLVEGTTSMVTVERNPGTHPHQQVAIDGSVFDDMEEAGGMTLDVTQRAAIQQALQDYAWVRANLKMSSSRAERKKLDKLAETLETTIAAMDVIARYEKIVFWRAGIDPEEEQERLKLLKRHCLELREELSGSGRPPDIFLSSVMGVLESVFVATGGGSTGVAHNDDNVRESRFVNFAYAALRKLPGEIKPHSLQGLMGSWELLHADRNRRSSGIP